MEFLIIVLVAALVIWWFFLREPLDVGTKETLVAPYKVETAPVVEQPTAAPVAEPVVQATLDVDKVMVTTEAVAVAPTLVVDTISTEPVPVAKKAKPATAKKTAGTKPAVTKAKPAAKTVTKPAAKPRVKKV